MKKTVKKSSKLTQQLISAPIADLKARLSMYLKLVKSGREVVITDHKSPVARVVAFEDTNFVVQESKFKPLNILKLAALPATGKTDSLVLLMQDRGKR